MCYLFVFEKNGIWEKLILIAFHFRVKIIFFDKIIFLKILNKHLKMIKVIFLTQKIDFFSLKIS